ncbi:signal peptidase I [Halapricum desulfuricans]|uniref:Signal peptidase I n=1 Tax=Halapricum desulfuricans TaxID=2841257 RepID=A0A897NAH1_9EURY|nr:signal peptidase I [Halapricum desulfuricans]QSG07999.1 Signal peptidase I [Halapricum desulfuricans]
MNSLTERLPGVRRVAAALAVMVLIVAVVPFVVFAVPQVVGADHGFVILSGSMEPTTSPGDVVIVDASAPISVGDIITFDDGNTVPTTHRVVAIEDGQYVTQGDANSNPDAQPVSPDDVLGRVTLTIPFIGRVILWVNTPIGYVSLVVGPLVLLVANELFAWAGKDSSSGDGSDTNDDDRAEGGPVPKPVLRRIDDGRAEQADAASATRADTDRTSDNDTATESDDARETVAVAVADLKLTVLATLGLVGYAAWNVYREVTAVAAPDPVSVGALTGGLLGLGFAIWVTVTARLAAGDAGTDRPATTPSARADGGTEDER